jgi:hypothetical protein
MSLQNEIAKIYVRLVFREDGEFDSLKTQRELSLPEARRALKSQVEFLSEIL